ncbi:hypothetical protein B0H12DRAFT_831005 [Mycena haematopus]|nr:hypothetical protein B0H12DRAFT_831005 [Mycena haematopus]
MGPVNTNVNKTYFISGSAPSRLRALAATNWDPEAAIKPEYILLTLRGAGTRSESSETVRCYSRLYNQLRTVDIQPSHCFIAPTNCIQAVPRYHRPRSNFLDMNLLKKQRSSL